MVWLCKTKVWWKSKIMPYGCIVYIKTDDIYKDIAEDVETRYDTSKTVGLIVKTYSYLIDDGIDDKKAKNTK